MTVYVLQYSYMTTNFMGEAEDHHDILGVYMTMELAREARDKSQKFGAYISPYEVQE